MLNKVELAGGLVRDPELKFGGQDGALAICRFTVALDETIWNAVQRAKEVKTSYISVVAFGELGEVVADRYKSADQVYVVGQLTQQELEGADGKKERKTKVRALTVTGVRKARRGEVSVDDPPPF